MALNLSDSPRKCQELDSSIKVEGCCHFDFSVLLGGQPIYISLVV